MRSARIAGMIALMAVVMLTSVSFSSAFAYSSSVTAEGEIRAVCHSVLVYEEEDEHDGPVVNEGTKYTRKSDTQYEFTSAEVSSGYSLKVTGQGNYALDIDLSDASTFLPSVSLEIQGNTYSPVALSGGSGHFTITDSVFAAGTPYDFKLSIPGCTGTSNELTLGTIRFTMVSLGESTTVPSPLTISGTSVSVSGNRVTAESGGHIEDSDDAEEAIDDINNNEPIPDKTPGSSIVYNIEAVEGTDEPTVKISYDSTGVDPNLTQNALSVNFTMNIPANMIFYIHVKNKDTSGNPSTLTFKINGSSAISYSGPLSSTDRYVYGSGTVVYNNSAPTGENVWISTGDSTASIEITGNRHGGHELELYIVMRDAPLKS